LSTQKNKRNFSTVTSRVRASPRSTNHCRCQIPDEQERKSADYTIFRWPRSPNSCCRHNSSITATAVAAATPISKMKVMRPLEDHRKVLPAHSRSPPFPEPRNAFARDKTPHPSTTPRFHERMSSRRSYVLHTRRRRVLTLTTRARLPAGQTTCCRPPLFAWPVEVKVT